VRYFEKRRYTWNLKLKSNSLFLQKRNGGMFFQGAAVSPLLKGQKRSKRQAEKVAKCQLKGETH
jgi:hypothetical protein